jgi:predicted nucleic acid-binding protein
MKVFDSNLLIYSNLEEYKYLRALLRSPDVYVSAVSNVEVLGFHKITDVDKAYFEALFRRIPQIVITDEILDKAVELRQKKRMSAGDAIIAATAVIHNATLYTRNTKDFEFLTDIKTYNPIE